MRPDTALLAAQLSLALPQLIEGASTSPAALQATALAAPAQAPATAMPVQQYTVATLMPGLGGQYVLAPALSPFYPSATTAGNTAATAALQQYIAAAYPTLDATQQAALVQYYSQVSQVQTAQALSSSSAELNVPLTMWRPEGVYDPALDTTLVTEQVSLEEMKSLVDPNCTRPGGRGTDCPEDKVIVKVEMLSVDAFIRTMMDEEAYHGVDGMGIPVGAVVPAIGYGTIVAAGSQSGKSVGQKVLGSVGAQTYATVPVGGMRGVHPFMKIPLHRPEAMLNLFGLTTGLTAYMGIFKVLSAPASHETCVVSAAAGAVGCLAAQLAKSNGARVIGIAGGAEKCKFLKDTLQLDGAVDYKSEIPMDKQLDEIAPDGVDFFFDNVGGQTLDVILDRIRAGGRVVICGAVSQYSGNLNKGKVEGPRNYLKLAERGATMKGFNVMQYMSSVPGAMCQLAWLHYRGYLRIHEDIQEGIEAFPNALQKLFIGGHTGKMLCRVASET
ncbi:unnamed protein product [Durusdinium trenchii]|uniref:Alcohol dehydrogenase-like C-terminal domain-containing protein n=1 Tax=Durusdinium trenchii TaxID=1381693 RepID=A0ABP0JJK0_9DINO